jgi:hypothetical protein
MNYNPGEPSERLAGAVIRTSNPSNLYPAFTERGGAFAPSVG